MQKTLDVVIQIVTIVVAVAVENDSFAFLSFYSLSSRRAYCKGALAVASYDRENIDCRLLHNNKKVNFLTIRLQKC